MITPVDVSREMIYFDTPWMLGAGIFLLILGLIPPVLKINRWKGVVMVLVYLLYLYLIF
jgi:Ca2+/Na+ antiporter